MSSTKAEATPPVAPRDASTVVLLRDARDGVEVFLVQRAASIAFMGGLFVFPGGKLDQGDVADAIRARIASGLDCSAVRAFSDAVDLPHSVGLAVTAVRETLEEAGLLLGVTRCPPELDALRQRLLDGESFATLLAQHALSLDLSPLAALSRWITPTFEQKRYDTRFYVARAPGDQLAGADARETVASRWLAPAQAIDEARSGAIKLAPPTLHTLELLSGLPDVDSALALARSRPPPLIEPLLRQVGDQIMVIYPGDPEHPIKEPAMPGPTRLLLPRR
jgi:8-oxo-dGTP pyrophosphatase MutT (NUDIX family)